MGSRATQRAIPQIPNLSLLNAAGRGLQWLVAAALVASAITVASHSAPQAERASLNALYCGGRLVYTSRNPYLFHSVAWCERNTAGPNAILAPAAEAPYDLAVVAPFTALPFRAFALICFVVMAIAFLIAVSAVGKIAQLPVVAIAIAFAPLAFVCARSGEPLTIVCLSALCVSAFNLSRMRYGAAGVALAVAMCEPELALPPALGLLLFMPRARVALVISAVALCILSIAVLGARASGLFMLAELPRYVRAELVSPGQYGIPWIAHSLGARIGLAFLLGALAFVFAIAIVTVLARRSAALSQRPEVLILLPPLASVCAGISVHLCDMIVAVPAALLALSHIQRALWLRFATLVLVAIPWQSFSALSSRTAEMAGAIAATHVFPPSAVSSLYWQVYLQALYPRVGLVFADFAWKLPSWAGLALLVILVAVYSQFRTGHLPTSDPATVGFSTS